MRSHVSALMFFLFAILASAPAIGAGEPPQPYALADAMAFRGRIEYAGYRVDGGRRSVVRGMLLLRDDEWSLDETAPGYRLHADAGASYVQSGGLRAILDDPFSAPGLVNAWALALGVMARAVPASVGGSATAWRTLAGIAYTTPAGDRIVGLAQDTSDGAAFTFDDWTNVDGMLLPRRILRLRRSVADASFLIASYSAVRSVTPPGTTVPRRLAGPGTSPPGGNEGAGVVIPRSFAAAFPWRQVGSAFGLLLLGLCAVVWTRRDALTDRLCRRLAIDPRGWRDVGISLFVSPDGRLFCDGNFYRVGAEFFARAVRVQRSPLFLRVSADGASRTAVVPRKFRPLHARGRSKRAAAFTLIEVLGATALFVIVVVGGIYPAMVATAQANQLAHRREAAVAIAQNVLNDQEAAAMYGATTPGNVTTSVDSMTVIVSVAASDVPGAQDVIVTVGDAAHGVLARAATVVGPPVPPPSDATTGQAVK